MQISPTPMEQFEQAGYRSTHAIVNMCTVFFLIIILVFSFALLGILSLAAPHSKCAEKANNWLGKVLLWGTTVRFFSLVYLIVAIASIHNLYYIEPDFSSVFSIVMLIILFMFACKVSFYQFYGWNKPEKDL